MDIIDSTTENTKITEKAGSFVPSAFLVVQYHRLVWFKLPFNQ